MAEDIKGESKLHNFTSHYPHALPSSFPGPLPISRPSTTPNSLRVTRPVMPSDFPPRALQHISIPSPNPSTNPLVCSPVKKDGILPTGDTSLDLLDTASDSDGTSSVEPQMQLCPCCKRQVNLHGVDYHNHLVVCLKTSKNGSKKTFSTRDDKKKIKDIRKVISKLDLHLRIGIMESLNRLSRGVTSEPPSPRFLPTSGTNAEASDKQVLALLYGKRMQQMRARRRSSKLTFKLPRNMIGAISPSAVRSISLTKPAMKRRQIKLDKSIENLNFPHNPTRFMQDTSSLLTSLA
eukprot:1009839-Amorphochlora_amoeboformis.AAC.1